MGKSCNFQLKYDGAALAESAIDVNVLAPALLALSEALSLMNQLANNEKTSVALQIKALNKGCFIIDFELVQSVFSQVGVLLTGAGVASYCNAYTLIRSVIDVISIKKWLSGRKPDKVEFSDDNKTVVIYLDQSSKTVNYWGYKGSQDLAISEACSKIAEPLKSEGIDSMEFTEGDENSLFTKDDVDAIFATLPDRVLTSSTSECVVMIEAAVFKDNAKWKVRLGEKESVFVTISDAQFLQDIDNGKERFGKGDVLFVDIETKQVLKDGRLQVLRDIKKVREHKISAEQLRLF